ncbi:MAG TPA: serine/threonine-protein kinase, partial [Myxococcus sp.]|nr:serine/threonine-protein kinase [Myxococcus sp.]
VGAVKLEGCGHWPDAAPRFLYLVMPYVRGCRLDAWVKEKNPTARQVALLVRELARQLVAMHRAGVVHRDVKSANVLVRHADGRPVLVDFGVSTYVGAPEITHPLLLPGTRYYRSPEALRFRREHLGEHSPARASDDLWALGVVLYWLLTGAYPFDTEVADEGALADVILRGEPVPPHERNPRVPRALSELCLRMLEKSREARYPDAAALGAALEAVLAQADTSWDVALCEAWGPDDATTEQREELSLDGRWERLQRLAAYERQHPRRGRPVAPEEASTLPRTTEAGRRTETSDEAERPARRRTRSSRWRTVAGGGAVLVLGLLGGLAMLRLPSKPPLEVASTHAVDSSSTTRKVTTYGQEVAPPWCPLDGGAGAAPVWAPTPAPVASATLPEDSTRVKTPRKALSSQKQQQEKQSTVLDTTGKVCTLVWISGQLACASPATEVRPPAAFRPPPAECPPQSVQTMKDLGLRFDIHDREGMPLPEYDAFHQHRPVTVRSGAGVTLKLDGKDWGKLPAGTVFSGTLFVGETRVFGRFTEAHTPEGQTYSVCMEVEDGDGERGMRRYDPGGAMDTAKIRGYVGLTPVKAFK